MGGPHRDGLPGVSRVSDALKIEERLRRRCSLSAIGKLGRGELGIARVSRRRHYQHPRENQAVHFFTQRAAAAPEIPGIIRVAETQVGPGDHRAARLFVDLADKKQGLDCLGSPALGLFIQHPQVHQFGLRGHPLDVRHRFQLLAARAARLRLPAPAAFRR